MDAFSAQPVLNQKQENPIRPNRAFAFHDPHPPRPPQQKQLDRRRSESGTRGTGIGSVCACGRAGDGTCCCIRAMSSGDMRRICSCASRSISGSIISAAEGSPVRSRSEREVGSWFAGSSGFCASFFFFFFFPFFSLFLFNAGQVLIKPYLLANEKGRHRQEEQNGFELRLRLS